MPIPKTTYCGIMDCYGIDSFMEEKNANKTALYMRVQFNRQRHAIFYEVDLTIVQSTKIKQMIEKKDYIGACKKLKVITCENIRLPKEHHKSFMLIPNPDLDPYG